VVVVELVQAGMSSWTIGAGQDVELDDGAGIDGVEVDDTIGGLEGFSTTGVGEAGVVFFLVDLGVRSRRRASRFPTAVMASPTSRVEPRIVTTREPDTTVGDTDSLACERS
jgi:hypothetical protein